MSEKKLGDHRIYLKGITQNITKMGAFSDFPRGTWGEFYKSWFKSNKFQFFRLFSKIPTISEDLPKIFGNFLKFSKHLPEHF